LFPQEYPLSENTGHYGELQQELVWRLNRQNININQFTEIVEQHLKLEEENVASPDLEEEPVEEPEDNLIHLPTPILEEQELVEQPIEEPVEYIKKEETENVIQDISEKIVNEFARKKDLVLAKRRKKKYTKQPQTRTERAKIRELVEEPLEALRDLFDVERHKEAEDFKNFITNLQKDEQFGSPEEDKIINMERKQLLENFLKHKIDFKRFEQPDDDKFILIQPPVSQSLSKHNLEQHRKPDKMKINDGALPEDAAIQYEFFQIGNFDDINAAINEVVDEEIKNNAFVEKPTTSLKIKATYFIQIQRTRALPGSGYAEAPEHPNVYGDPNNPPVYVKYELTQDKHNKADIIPHTFRLSDRLTEQNNLFLHLRTEVQKMMDWAEEHESSTKFILVYGLRLNVSRIRGTGALVPGFEELYKNQHIYKCDSLPGCCVLECIYISINEEEYKGLKSHKSLIIPRIKKQYFELFGKQFPEKDRNFDMNELLEKASNKLLKRNR
jgi:hypothetical protein